MWECFCPCSHEKIQEITSLDASDHPDKEACTVIERQIDVEDVFRRDSTCRLDEGGGQNPLMSDNSCFRQTCEGQRIINHLRYIQLFPVCYSSSPCFYTL